jgi:hypothetical protein
VNAVEVKLHAADDSDNHHHRDDNEDRDGFRVYFRGIETRIVCFYRFEFLGHLRS